MLRTFVIANPTSGAGAVRREWSAIERMLKSSLSEYDVAFTKGSAHATMLAREALRAGWEAVVAIGGDGTVNEIVNGFFEPIDARRQAELTPEGWLAIDDALRPSPINPEAVFGVVPLGTGGDFRRSIGLAQGWRAAIGALSTDAWRAIDLGQIVYFDQDGLPASRLFVNIASGGLSGDVDARVNRSSKRLGGAASFAIAALRSYASYKNSTISMRVDGGEATTESLLTFIVANGQYFGGGMWIAPGASLSDGALELVTIGDVGKLEAIPTLARVYSGTHLSSEKVARREARTIEARAAAGGREVLLDVDGEQPGRLPASFRVLPDAIRLKV